MSALEFRKLHGCGNDFIFIDNRDEKVELSAMSALAQKFCAPKLGIGADGLVFLQKGEKLPDGRDLDFRWNFYNADGSRAEMCGNASRCAAWLAVELGIAGPQLLFGTDAGPIQAEVDHAGRSATVELTPPGAISLDNKLEVEGQSLTLHSVNTGVPHAVLIQEDNSQTDVLHLGRLLRYHAHFSPKGTNVNFVSLIGPDHLRVRTYERGVEDETLACGTGAAASAIIANALGLTGTEVQITTSGMEHLGISLRKGIAFLSGGVTQVFVGTIDPQWLATN